MKEVRLEVHNLALVAAWAATRGFMHAPMTLDLIGLRRLWERRGWKK